MHSLTDAMHTVSRGRCAVIDRQGFGPSPNTHGARHDPLQDLQDAACDGAQSRARMAKSVLTMNAFLSHIDMAPVFYGVILAVGVFSMLNKLLRFDVLGFAVEAGTFFVVFSMHKGTLTGGMSAAICALIVGVLYKRVLR